MAYTASLGALSPTAQPIAELDRWRTMWPELMPAAEMRSAGITVPALADRSVASAEQARRGHVAANRRRRR